MFALIVSSCGGGGGGESDPVPTPTPIPSPTPANKAPTVSITSPSDNAVLAEASAELSATATDEDGTVTSVLWTVQEDGTIILTETTATPFSATIDLTTVPDGTYVIQAIAKDDDDAESAVSSITVTVKKPESENQPPVVAITSPSDGMELTEDDVVVTLDATDADGSVLEATVSLLQDGNSVFEKVLSGTPFSATIDLTTVPDGTYVIQAIAKDDDDAESAVSSITVTVKKPESPEFISFELSTYVLVNEDISSTEILATGKATGIDCLKATVFRENEAEIESFMMCDDGENGDITADDGDFRRVITLDLEPLELRGYPNDDGVNQGDGFRILVTFMDAQGEEIDLPLSQQRTNPRLSIGVIARNLTVPVTEHPDGIRTTSHVANILVSSTYSNANLEDRQSVTRSMCNLFPGVQFDFFVMENYFRPVPEPIRATAYHIRISNANEGIGISIGSDYDEANDIYLNGCPGLKSVGILTGIVRSGFGFVHEIGHSYSMFLEDTNLWLSNYTQTGFDFQSRFHWGHSSICDSIMSTSGFCLVDMGDGNLQAVIPSLINETSRQFGQFHPWDLYLCGLLPASELQPEWFITNPERSLEIDEIISKTDPDVQLVSVQDDVIPVYGDRLPRVGQDAFRVGCIAISEEPMSDFELAFETLKCKHMESDKPGSEPLTQPSLEWATRGRATFTTELP
jgi:hypothetical protein